MSRPTQLLILLLECTLLTFVVLVILPRAISRNHELVSQWNVVRRAQITRDALERNAVAVEETARGLEQALTELRRHGTEARNLNQLPQELSNLVKQVGLRLDRFQHMPSQPIYGGTRELGRSAAVVLVLVGDYPALLQLLDLQRERLPGLKVDRLLIRRSNEAELNKLIVDVTFSTPLFSEPKLAVAARDPDL